MNALNSLKLFTPELILLIGAFAAFFIDFFVKNKKWVGIFSICVLIAASFFTIFPKKALLLFFGLFHLDSFTYFFRFIAFGVVGSVILISLSYTPINKKYAGEYYGLFLFMAFALTLMASANNLLMIFLSIEFVSILSYILVGFLKKDKRSKEAAIKYLLFGSLASGIMLYGMSFLYGITGSLDLSIISKSIIDLNSKPLMLLIIIFMFTGFGFKISMAPFHMWAPDVYEGAPTPVTTFLAIGSKALGFAVLIRVLATVFMPFWKEWSLVLTVLSILTMTIGNITALSQNNIKRLLAYSSIAQAGYILMGVAVFSKIGIEAVLIYLIAYIIATLGAFTAVIMVSGQTGSDEISDYACLSKRSPFVSALLTIFLLSLTGLPPLAGFIGKYFVFAGAIEAGFITLALFAAINSIVAAFYYFRVIKVMYLTSEEEDSAPLHFPKTLSFMLWVMFAGTLLVGLIPSFFINIIKQISIL